MATRLFLYHSESGRKISANSGERVNKRSRPSFFAQNIRTRVQLLDFANATQLLTLLCSSSAISLRERALKYPNVKGYGDEEKGFVLYFGWLVLM